MGHEDEMMMRKGPWTEEEDVQLVYYVNMFGHRRWDFIAKVSGLRRSGKSCRLRWVNYLHPGLKKGKMTPHEERRVLELQSRWGNRWSKIARKLPGRTDNEIKNYWRTHMRKKAQEKKKKMSESLSLSNSSSTSSVCSSNPTVDSMCMNKTKETSSYDTRGMGTMTITKGKSNNNMMKSTTTHNKAISEGEEGYYLVDEVWKDIDLLEDVGTRFGFDPYSDIAPSPTWDYSLNTFWMIDGQEDIGTNMFFPKTSEQFNTSLIS